MKPRNKPLSGWSLKKKTTLYSVLLILLPSVLIWTFSLSFSVEENRKRAVSSIELTLEQAQANIGFHVQQANSVLDYLALDPYTVSFLRKSSLGLTNAADVIDGYFMLTRSITNITNLYQNMKIRVFFRDPKLLTVEKSMFFSLASVPDAIRDAVYQSRMNNMILSPGQSLQLDKAQNKRITVARKITDLASPQNNLGIVVADIGMKPFMDILDSVDLGPGRFVFITDNSQLVMSQSAKVPFDPEEAMGGLALANGRTMECGGVRYAFFHTDIRSCGWKLTAMVPESQISSGQFRIGLITLAFSLCFAVMALLVMLRFQRRIVSKLQKLAYSLKAIESGDFGWQTELDREPEFRYVEQAFNTMSSTIRSLLDERSQTRKNLLYAELKALDNQINPHFIYNTLDAVKWKALRNNDSEVVSIVEVMARFFRSSLRGGKQEVSLRDEFEHIGLYIELQNIRFGNTIGLTTAIADGLEEYCILRFLLQPLVENAIKHGISEKPSHRGTVELTATQDGEAVRIRVADDGVGMPEEQFAGILENHSAGYGITNVHARIQLFYGNEYGLRYLYSGPGGTAVEIVLPHRREPGANELG